MNPNEASDTSFPGSTTAIGKALLAAPVMRPWPPSLEEACAILTGQPYEVLERIGHGGMGAVFKVRNQEPGMKRLEAIKIRRPEARDDDLFRERFLREISTLAQLRHPGITTIYRSGDSDEGYLWFSMEFLEGLSLAELLAPDMTALPPERVLDIIRQLCITLQFIHKAGRLHRDLKPANVMVCEDGSVRLLDFGIARPSEPVATGLLTRPGEAPHTPDYAAPEQKNGGAVDERTDLYGLGRIITEMIRPAKGTSRERPTTYPQRLLDLVDDLLAFDQRNRPNSAAAVFEKLGQIEPGSPDFWGKDRCPFRGLEAYQPEHAEIFFGRDAAIRRGKEILLTGQETPWNGFLLIIGASGAGKSSLARAGLGPALLQKDDPDGESGEKSAPVIFDLCTVRAEDECLLPPLARALAATIPGCDPSKLAESLRNPGSDLAPVLGLKSVPALEIRLCLILDQFEHFFRQSLPRNAQTRFVTSISRIARVPGVAVLVTMRSDFYHHCAEHTILMDLKEGHQMDLVVPQPWELAAMLRLGARASGLKFECLPDGRGLDDVLLDQARRNPQTLPLLSYMLEQLWERRDRENGLLRVSDYEELGGLEGAVAAKATDTFNRFIEDYPEKPDECLDILFRLVVETSDSSDTPAFVRRLASFDEIAASDPDVRSLAERFVASRLFVTIGDGEHSNSGLTLAHECLLRVWPRAVAWADHNRDFLQTRTRIGMRMKEGSPLLEGDPLLEAARTHTLRQPESFTPKQLEFVRNATTAMEAKARRTKRRRKLAFSVLGTLSVVATIGGALAWQMKIVADEQTSIATIQRGEVTRQRDDQEALLWTASRSDHETALRAFDDNNYPDGMAYLDRALGYRPGNRASLAASASYAFGQNAPAWNTRTVFNFDSNLNGMAVSPDGRILAVSNMVGYSTHGNVHLVDLATGKDIIKIPGRERGYVSGRAILDFSPDGRYYAEGTGNTARAFVTATGEEIVKIKLAPWRFVKLLKFSPDGRFLLVVGKGREVDAIDYDWVDTRMIELATTKKYTKLKQKNITAADFSPEGRYLAVGSGHKDKYGNICLIEVASGMEIKRMESTSDVQSLSYSPDGQYLVAGLQDNTIRVLDSSTGKELHNFACNRIGRSLEISPDSRFLAFCDGEASQTVRVIQLGSGKNVGQMDYQNEVTAVSFSPDARFLAAGSRDHTVRVIDTASGTETCQLNFKSAVESLLFSPDGSNLIVEFSDRSIRILDMMRGLERGKQGLGSGMALAFSPDSKHLIAGGSGDVQVIDVATNIAIDNSPIGERTFSSPIRNMMTPYSSPIGYKMTPYISPIGYTMTPKGKAETFIGLGLNPMSFSPDGGRYVVGDSGGTARLIELTSGREISRFEFGGVVREVDFSSDGRYLSAGSMDGTARVFEVATGKEISKVEFGANVNSVSFSPDGHHVAVGSSDSTVRVIEAATGKEISRLEFEDVVKSVRFSADGRHLAAGSSDKSARVIEAATGKEISKVIFAGSVCSLDFSPDGKHLVVGCDDKSTRVVEALTGREISRFEFGDSVTSVSFFPDGIDFAAGSRDGTARVIEAETGKEIRRMELGGPVTAVVCSPDGHYFAAGGNDFALVISREFSSSENLASAWRSALRVQSGVQYQPDGRLSQLSHLELLTAQREVTDFISHSPRPNEHGQHSILRWHQTLPELRTITPWSEELMRIAVGRGLMKERLLPSAIVCYADLAPWHPLEPLSLARLKPKPVAGPPLPTQVESVPVEPVPVEPVPDDRRPSDPAGVKSGAPSAPTGFREEPTVVEPEVAEPEVAEPEVAEPKVVEPPPIQPTDPATREAMMHHQRFLARLTLKRLREADEKLYGRDTLAEYAAWSAKIMHEELHLDPESLEAINFALERTPENKQQPLLDLKEKLLPAE